jgi:hypothetical protein
MDEGVCRMAILVLETRQVGESGTASLIVNVGDVIASYNVLATVQTDRKLTLVAWLGNVNVPPGK